MKQELLFVWHILTFNAIKPLPCSSQYFNNHFRLPRQSTVNDSFSSHYRQIVRVGKEQSGWLGMILANIALMFLCLPISITADCIIHITHLLSIKIIVNGVLVLMMLVKFDVLHFRDSRNYLKLLYIFSSLISSSYWILTCVFLAAFENIMF